MFAVHTFIVPRATTVVVCWLLPPEQNQLVSQHPDAHMYTENFTTSANAGDISGKASTVNTGKSYIFVGLVTKSLETRLLTHYDSGKA